MATTPSRSGRTPASPAVATLQWIWAAIPSLLFIAVGLALVGGGLLFAFVSAQAVLDPEDAGHAIAGVLFAVLGLAAAVGGVALVFRWRSRVVLNLSGRKPPTMGDGGGAYFSGFGGGGDGGCGGGDGGGSC